MGQCISSNQHSTDFVETTDHKALANIYIPPPTKTNSIQQQKLQTNDVQLFRHTTTKSKCAGNANDNIVDQCHHLKRLLHALQFYNNNKENNNKLWNEFCLNIYGNRILNDYHHLLNSHQKQLHQIKNEIIQKGAISECTMKDCQFSSRHFGEYIGRSSKIKTFKYSADSDQKEEEEKHNILQFYEQEYDSLHFNLFHLFDTGYRFQRPQHNKTHNDNIKFTKYVDNEFSEIVKTVTYNRNKYINICERFNNDINVNKYNINVRTHDDEEDEHNTFINRIFKYLLASGIRQNNLSKLDKYICEEQYDSDAIEQDVYQDIYHSNISLETAKSKCTELINDYIEHSKAEGRTFSTGLIFYYWPYFDPKKRHIEEDIDMYFNINDYSGINKDELYIENSKYKDIKEEAINSGYCMLEQFMTKVVLKSKKYIQISAVRNMKAKYQSRAQHYGIDKNTPISLQHLQSIILYTDFTRLSGVFSSTFRRAYFGEPLEKIKKRNKRFYYMSKILRETVELYGNTGDEYFGNIKEHGPFYCGMNRIMALPSFSIRICGPLSTSKQREIGIRFAKQEGMVLRLNNNADNYSIAHLKFFNCSFISNYKEEDERLFVGGMWRIRVESIMNVNTKQNFIKAVKPLFIFDSIISGADMAARDISSNKSDIILLKHLISHIVDNKMRETEIYDEYIYETWEIFTKKKKNIVINMYLLDLMRRRGFSSEILSLILYLFGNNNNIFKPTILSLFKNAQNIIFYTTDYKGDLKYKFSWSSFFSLLWGNILFKHQSLQSIQIKATHKYTKASSPRECIDRSWIYREFSLYQKKSTLTKLNQTQFKISLNLTKFVKHSKTYNEDSLSIVRL
eukprot:118944_1